MYTKLSTIIRFRAVCAEKLHGQQETGQDKAKILSIQELDCHGVGGSLSGMCVRTGVIERLQPVFS